jgi:hypothetical protein
MNNLSWHRASECTQDDLMCKCDSFSTYVFVSAKLESNWVNDLFEGEGALKREKFITDLCKKKKLSNRKIHEVTMAKKVQTAGLVADRFDIIYPFGIASFIIKMFHALNEYDKVIAFKKSKNII